MTPRAHERTSENHLPTHDRRRGASLATYGAAVGLVALAASLAVTTTGERISGLTARVGGSVNAVDGAISGNQGPVFEGSLPSAQSIEAHNDLAPMTFTGFRDAEGDALVYELVLSGGLDRDDLLVTPEPDGYTVAGTPMASGTVAVTARDPIGRSVTAGPVQITVDPNDPPAPPFTPPASSASEGASVQLVYTGIQDPDDTDLDFAMPAIPGASFSHIGTDLTVSFIARPGQNGAVLTVTDPHGATTSAPPLQLDVTPVSCASLHASDSQLPTGGYTIDPDGPASGPPISVTCDMDTDGGGWTVLTPGLVHNTLGGAMTFADAPDDSGFDSADRPYTRQINEAHVAFYDFTVPLDTTEFRLAAYDLKANSQSTNPSEAGLGQPTSGFDADWSIPADWWGDIGFGTPTTRVVSIATLGQVIQCTDCIRRHPASDQTYALPGATDTFRIGWAESGGREGWFPWWAGTILVR